MFLVGVISENKEIIKILKQKFEINEVDIIDLDIDIIDNFKNIKFDIVLISNSKKYFKNNSFKKILLKSSICVINADIKYNLEILEYIKGIIITYGFNSKATITASSVNDNKIFICIQRNIENINKQKIEPIEYIQDIGNLKNVEISDIIGIKTIEILLTKRKFNQI